jgi:hypothetical protein
MRNVADGVFRWIRTGLQTVPLARVHGCHFASGKVLRRKNLPDIISDSVSAQAAMRKVTAVFHAGRSGQ